MTVSLLHNDLGVRGSALASERSVPPWSRSALGDTKSTQPIDLSQCPSPRLMTLRTAKKPYITLGITFGSRNYKDI